MGKASARVPDVAALIEQGARPTQQDAVRVEAHDDGSWMLAVADGTGFGPCPEDAAGAALDGMPTRVSGDDEMLDAFMSADEAVSALHQGPGTKPETTLAVAAWTPEAGLTAGWIGDTLIWMAPLEGCVTWCGEPTEIRGRVPLIGQFGSRRTLSIAMRLMSNDLPRKTAEALISAGMIVMVMSDGAYAHPSIADAGRLTFRLPVTARRSAQCAARWVITEAMADGLHDNAAVAAVRIPP